MKAYTAVFIGHREYSHANDIYLHQHLLTLIRLGYTRFLSGGMGEFDSACEEAVLGMKASYPHIRLCLVQNDPDKAVNASRYDEIILPEMLKPGLKSVSIPVRNKLMIESASAAICYVHRSSGGAYTSFKVAAREGLLIYCV